MRRDPQVYLWDALRAAELLEKFSNGKSFADFKADDLLKSAVERQFEIIGEALNQLEGRARGGLIDSGVAAHSRLPKHPHPRLCDR